jgi:hypothetical protein
MPFKPIDKIQGSDTGLTEEDILTFAERARGPETVEPMRIALMGVADISIFTVAEMTEMLDRVARG